MKKILIAIDEGPSSEKVAASGFQLGRQLNAEIGIVSVVDTTFIMTEGAVTPKEMIEMMKEDFTKRQKQLMEKIFGEYQVSAFVQLGKPYETILKTAGEWGADLIVLGTHGRTGLSHLLMGSVAEKVVRHSTKPLFIIPTR